MNIKWEWMVEYRECFGCQTTKIPPWMWCACVHVSCACVREERVRVRVWIYGARKCLLLDSAELHFDDWLPNANEKMCFNCVLRRLHIRFRKFNCFYFGVSSYDSIILISNFRLFFLLFFRSLIIMCSNRSTFIYCLLKIYMLQTPRTEWAQTKLSLRRDENDAVRPNQKIRLFDCLYRAQLKHRRVGIHTRVRWVSFDYSRSFFFLGIVLCTILSCTRHTTQ